jgi:hypothetical protein
MGHLYTQIGIRASVFGKGTRLLAARPRVQMPVGAKVLSLLKNFHNVSEAQPDTWSVGTGIISRE